MVRTGTTSTWLSVAITAALALAFFVPCLASTDVYYLRPQANTHNNSYNSVSQTFVSTCDSITKIAFFIGQNSGSSNYLMEFDSAGIAKGGVLTLSATLAKPYAENEGTYGSPVPVKRGYTYTLRISRQTPSHKVDFFYLADTMAYPWGKITDPIVTGDLCARVAGTGRVLDIWGMNLYGLGQADTTLDNCGNRLKELGVRRVRDQIPGGMHGWGEVWLDTLPCNARWELLDTIITNMAEDSVEVSFNPFGSSYQAACIDTVDGAGYYHHWISDPDNLKRYQWAMFFPPVNLFKPVMDSVGTGINPHNYWAKFMYEFIRRYGPKDSRKPAAGKFWQDHTGLNYLPVRYWEIDNEVNWHIAWPATVDSGFPNRDYNSDTAKATFLSGASGRQAYWMNLYVRRCIIADSVARFLYPNRDSIKILTHSLNMVNRRYDDSFPELVRGRSWLRKFYDSGGKPYSDGITYHAYQDAQDGQPLPVQRFVPQYFQMDYDTVRAIMKANTDNGLCWAVEQGWGTTDQYLNKSSLFVRPSKQADCIVQMYTMGASEGANPYGPLGWMSLYQLRDYKAGEDSIWVNKAGVVKPPYHLSDAKPSYYAFKQMTGKLKDKYFNRRVPLADTNVYCYEFQKPGPDTAKKTWVVWRAQGNRDTIRIPVRTLYYDTVKIAYTSNSDSQRLLLTDPSGFVVQVRDQDSIPIYIHEDGTPSRPDIIVDSLWIYPDTARAGDNVWFYARLKNVGNATLSAGLGNAVTFQVDGVSKKTYTDSREIKKDSTIIVGYNPNPPPGDAIQDWTATWGDHLIRAWVDSSDKYVELREDNNQGYLFKHMKPKGKVIIPTTGYNQGYPTSGRKFTNTRYVTLSMLSNGGTIPHADSMRIKNGSGTWKPWRRDSTYWLDTLSTEDEKKWVYAQFKMVPSETSARVADSVILDMTLPVAQISSPANGATVSGTVPFWGIANDSGYPPRYFRVDTLRYYWNSSTHDTIHVSWTPIGSKAKQVVTGLLGNWNTTLVPNSPPAYKETLAVWDSAGNYNCKTIDLNVLNSITDGGASWTTGFGTYTSPVMNVATDIGGNVYFAETQNSKIRKYSSKKDSLFAFSARRSDSTGLNWAVGMVLKDSTTLYVADGYNHCVKAFDRQGNLLLRFGSFGQEPGQFKQPCGIALDHKGRLFVVDRLNHRVQVFSDSSGGFLFQFGSQGADSGRFNSPTGIAYVPRDTALGLTQDLVYISDSRNNQIQVFDSLGNYLKTIKHVDSLGLDTPLGICSDRWGNVFVADSRHNRIVELNPYGQRILDFGGQGDSLWQFRTPVGVASSPGAHYLYVADMGNRRVTRFTVILEDSSGGGPQSGEIALRIPLVYSLAQSHPNPTTGEAVIAYGLPQESPVRLVVYNVAGQVVREYKPGKQEAGFYSYKWDGRSNLNHRVGAGVYFYRLEAGSWVKTRKMVVIR